MELKNLNKISDQESSKKLIYKHDELTRLLELLNKMLLKRLRSSELRILKLIEKELKLVPRNTYRTRWMAIGMSIFGIPMGVAFGASLGNMAFLAIGIPIGMSIGIAIGTGMDKKAHEQDKQLDIEIRPI